MRKLFFLILFIIAYSCNKANKIQKEYYLKTNKTKITGSFNGKKFPFTILNEDLVFSYTGRANKIAFISDLDSISFNLKPKDSLSLTFIINEKDSVSILAVGSQKPASFSQEYINKNKGKYEVLSPKVHELVNIAVALTDIGKKDNNMIPKNEYYKKVVAHFDAYKNHPLIQKLNTHITEVFGSETYNYYYNIRMNANMYSFEGDKIVNKSPFSRMGFGSENLVSKIIPELESFAEATNYDKFYDENKSYYQSLIDDYYRLVPIDKMWKWVEKKFPQRHNSYKIYFSPLVGGAHSTQKFKDNGFAETAMFVDAPILSDKYSDKEKEAILTRVVFTEIDHNYVNPTTDKFKEINTLLNPLNCWNEQKQGYNSSYTTFNEYMTWAVFTLYLYDNFDKKVFEDRNEKEANFMVNGRGFPKFKEFNNFVLDWYKKNPDTSLEKLYPQVIEWIKKQDCKE